MKNRKKLSFRLAVLSFSSMLIALPGAAQTQDNGAEVEQLKQMVLDLQRRVTVLEEENEQLRQGGAAAGTSGPQAAAALVSAAEELRVPGGNAPVVAQAAVANPA